MIDVVGLYLSDEMARYLMIWTVAFSAMLVFTLAFAVTRGAGFRCPLALLRGTQRFFLCCLAISLAYVGAYVAEYSADAIPLGPLLILFINFMIATMISGIRHLLSPAMADNNTWGGAWRLVHDRTLRMADDVHRSAFGDIKPPIRTARRR